MSKVHFPAHRLCLVSIQGNPVLLAATGTSILSLSFPRGVQLSSWPQDDGENSSSEDDEHERESSERPTKRQKLHDSNDAALRRHDSEASEASIEIVAEGQRRQKGERRRPKIPDTTLPNISHLIATSDSKNAIAITAEDKTVRVFSISRKGHLYQRSLRPMPKKCCAIALTADEKTILTADKFGDVYAVPLHPTPDYKPGTRDPQPAEAYRPSATELTVHTKGNLDALRQQMMQKQKAAKKEGLAFEHKLLLGHVSLLTDLAVAQGRVLGKQRSFILTSDRDEHIRVSRGIPQTHVIHNFCLGHTEFVTKLCIVPWNERALVAGNGEPSLRIYDWQDGQQKYRFDFMAQLRNDIESVILPARTADKLAISGIWPVSLGSAENVLLVALEGLPLLFSFKTWGFEIHHTQTLKLDANVLDIVQCQYREQDLLVVSVDTAHESGSCKEYRADTDEGISGIQFFSIKHAEVIASETATEGLYFERSDSILPWNVESFLCHSTVGTPGATANGSKFKDYERAYSTVGEFIYGLENLRKRRGKAAEEEEDDEEAQIENAE